jgi:agmatinase
MYSINTSSHIFLGSEIDQPDPRKALFHVLPVPYEKTVSYGAGTSWAPGAIITASSQLEKWDGKSRPCDEGIYTHPHVNCDYTQEASLSAISAQVRRILSHKGIPVVLGGEHTVTYAVIKAMVEAKVEDFGVVQIDAHADLRRSYEGNTLSHACAMRNIAYLGVPIHQLGVRALCEEELETRKELNISYQDAEELVPDNIKEVKLPDDFPPKVYFTLDVDGMDPSIFPTTGTPVPGGLGWYQTLSLFESVAIQREIIGFDLMELAPVKEFHAYDFSAATLVYKMMGIVQRAKKT